MELSCNRTLVILVLMGLSAALGLILLLIGCAVPFSGSINPDNWFGIFVLVFYLLSPIPLAIARRCSSDECLSEESSHLFLEVCYFISACIVVGGFGLPFVLARRAVIEAVAAGLIGAANIFVFGTIYSYFIFFGQEEEWDWSTF